MIGRTISRVDGVCGDDTMVFHAVDGSHFTFYHSQDCCESVQIEDIAGDVADLIGSPLLMAEAVDNLEEPPSEEYESCTWTFYKFRTAKGDVTVRWLGVSNGYYSEGVSYSENVAKAVAS